MPGLLTHLNKRYKGLIIAEALPVCWSISRSIPSLFVYKKARFSMWQWLYTRHSVGNLFFAVNPSCMGVMRCKYSNLGTIWRLSSTTRGESKAEKWWVFGMNQAHNPTVSGYADGDYKLYIFVLNAPILCFSTT